MSFYRRYGAFGISPVQSVSQRPRVDDPFPVGPGPVVPAAGPIFPPVPIEVQSFVARTPQDYSKPAMFDPRTAASFLPPRPVIDVPRWYVPGMVTSQPEGQVMSFPSVPPSVISKEVPPDYNSRGSTFTEKDYFLDDQGALKVEEETVAWTPDGLVAAPPGSPLVAAAVGAAGGFLAFGPLGAGIGGLLGFLVGKR